MRPPQPPPQIRAPQPPPQPPQAIEPPEAPQTKKAPQVNKPPQVKRPPPPQDALRGGLEDTAVPLVAPLEQVPPSRKR